MLQALDMPDEWWTVLEATGVPGNTEVTRLKTETV